MKLVLIVFAIITLLAVAIFAGFSQPNQVKWVNPSQSSVTVSPQPTPFLFEDLTIYSLLK